MTIEELIISLIDVCRLTVLIVRGIELWMQLTIILQFVKDLVVNAKEKVILDIFVLIRQEIKVKIKIDYKIRIKDYILEKK